MVSGHRNQVHTSLYSRNTKQVQAPRMQHSHTHTHIHSRNERHRTLMSIDRGRRGFSVLPLTAPLLSPSLTDPVPGPRHIWGRGRKAWAGLTGLLPARGGWTGSWGSSRNGLPPTSLPARAARGGGEGAGPRPRVRPCGWLSCEVRPPRGSPVRSRPEGAEPRLSLPPAPGRVGQVWPGGGAGKLGGRGSCARPGRGRDLSRARSTSWACEGRGPRGVSGCGGTLRLGPGV